MNPPKDSLNEREFELVNIVGAQLAANQRELSRQMKLSLGMTNMVLKRLVSKGYIRIQQLDHRKVQYILTPKGFAEKYHKSVHYTLKTIRSIGLIRNQLNVIIQRLYDQGERNFIILGNSDLAELVEMSLRQPQWAGVQFNRVEQIPDQAQGIIFICRENMDAAEFPTNRCVDLIRELASQKNDQFETVEKRVN